MSTSRQLSESRAIPTRTVFINETTQLPHDYCTTPGGTLFSTTPGGKQARPSASIICFPLGKPIEYSLLAMSTLPLHLPVVLSPWPRLPCHPDQNKNKAKTRLSALCCGLIGSFAAQRFRLNAFQPAVGAYLIRVFTGFAVCSSPSMAKRISWSWNQILYML